MTYEQAVRFFEEEAYMTHTNAEREARRGTSDPTYLVYALGKRMLMELREEARAKWGADFTLQRFHDEVVSYGYPPIPILRRLMFGEERRVEPGTAAPEALAAPAPEPRGFQAWAFPFAVWLGARVALIFASWAGMKVETRSGARGLAPQFSFLPVLEPFCRWDCGWYYLHRPRRVHGTPQTNFFPLLPMLTRALSIRHPAPAALGPARGPQRREPPAPTACLPDVPAARGRAERALGPALAPPIPSRFFYAAGHPESLMVLLSALAWTTRPGPALARGAGARGGSALAAPDAAGGLGLAGGTGAAASLPGPVLQEPGVADARAAVAVARGLLPVPAVVWGDFLTFYKGRRCLGRRRLLGHRRSVQNVQLSRRSPALINTYLPFAALMLVGVLLTARQRTWWPLAAFGLAFSVVIWANGTVGAGRYSASCWPAFLGWGAFTARRRHLGMLWSAAWG